MKVGYYSPLPPARTGVADYAAALLPELLKHGPVEIAPTRCDVALYQLGNNQLHREIYFHALARPGVAVLHDAVLQHFLLGSLSRDEYLNEFVHNYGEWSRHEAAQLWQDRAGSAQDPRYFARPLLKRIAETSLAIIVHNPGAAERVLEHSPRAKVVTIPHLFVESEAPDDNAVLAFRRRFGIPPRAYLFGVFGYLRESKRIIPLLQTFQKLHRVRPNTHILVAGEFVSEDLLRAAAPWLDQSGVHRTGYLNDRDFHLAAAAVDCCINLRYPLAGETSGIATRLMGIGKPLVVTEGPETSGLPETACFRIQPGIAEAHELLQYMMLASEFPDLAREAGRHAENHIRRYHSLTSVASLYWKTLCGAFSSSR